MRVESSLISTKNYCKFRNSFENETKNCGNVKIVSRSWVELSASVRSVFTPQSLSYSVY